MLGRELFLYLVLPKTLPEGTDFAIQPGDLFVAILDK